MVFSCGWQSLWGVARYVLSGMIYNIAGSRFPYGTMVVNLSGCFLVGFLDVLAEEKFVLGPNARVLLMVGFCGAFTTFSTWILETSSLVRDGQMLRGFANIVVAVLLGFVLVRLGVVIGRLV